MITVKAGSHVRQLLELLSITGEFPASALSLIGNERTLKILIHKLESIQAVRVADNDEIIRAKLITVSGKRNARTIRLAKGALPVLRSIDANAADYYLHSFGQRRFSGDEMHIGRNHRVSEAVALVFAAGIETRIHAFPKLSLTEKDLKIISPSFYIARDLKQIGSEELNKTSFTRFVGALFYPGGCYAVYNTRNSVMKWSATGERKIRGLLTDIARMNAGLHEVHDSLLLGSDESTALQTVMESDKTRKQFGRIDRVYARVLFVPLNSIGIRLLKILTLPDWNEKLLESLFTPAQRPKSFSQIECDAVIDGKLIFSHLDCDLARLIRFHDAMFEYREPVEALCYPWQMQFLAEYLNPHVKLIPIEMKEVECALDLK